MGKSRNLALLAASAILAAGVAAGVAAEPAGKKFLWTTGSAEAKGLLAQLQGRIESFQFGPESGELAKKIVAADPGFAMGHYYVAATTAGPEGPTEFARAQELAKQASEGERRFIDAMSPSIANQGAAFKDSIPPLEKLGQDYPNERLIFVVLGQLYQGAGDGDKALAAFERARAIGPRSPRVEAFIAGHELLEGHYAKARATYQEIEKGLPQGAVPFAIRYGTTFSYLYEEKVDDALKSLEEFLAEYRASRADQTFPEVFIWNSMARINLENGRLEAAMKDYEKGFESVPGSQLPDDQKKTWEGRLLHGKARTLAKMGRHEEADKLTEKIRQMIVDGGQPAEQFWPAYHYVAGYCKLEAGQYQAAAEHFEQADKTDPFHVLLLARAYEKLGQKEKARQAFADVVASKQTGIERALAYPEAKRKLATF